MAEPRSSNGIRPDEVPDKTERPPLTIEESLGVRVNLAGSGLTELDAPKTWWERKDQATIEKGGIPWRTILRLCMPQTVLTNVSLRCFFNKLRTSDAELDYLRKYSNRDEYRTPISKPIYDEIGKIQQWTFWPMQRKFSMFYVGEPFRLCAVRRRQDVKKSTSIVSLGTAFAMAALEYYKDAYQDNEEVSSALKSVEKFFSLGGRVNHEAAAWWLVGTMVGSRRNQDELVKGLKECHAMELVGQDLVMMELPKGGFGYLRIQPAKETLLLQGETLIPSFDFRVHFTTSYGHLKGHVYGNPVGFFEVKRTESLVTASDLTSLVKSTVSKLERPYQEKDGRTSTLGQHPSLKGLILQVPWPKPDAPVERRTKSGYRIMDSDGSLEYGYEKGGQRHVIKTVSFFDEMAAKFDQIKGADKLDVIYVTTHDGELLQTFYNHGKLDEMGMVLSQGRPMKFGGWSACGTVVPSARSYFNFQEEPVR